MRFSSKRKSCCFLNWDQSLIRSGVAFFLCWWIIYWPTRSALFSHAARYGAEDRNRSLFSEATSLAITNSFSKSCVKLRITDLLVTPIAVAPILPVTFSLECYWSLEVVFFCNWAYFSLKNSKEASLSYYCGFVCVCVCVCMYVCTYSV